jgi:hypothetical protein
MGSSRGDVHMIRRRTLLLQNLLGEMRDELQSLGVEDTWREAESFKVIVAM